MVSNPSHLLWGVLGVSVLGSRDPWPQTGQGDRGTTVSGVGSPGVGWIMFQGVPLRLKTGAVLMILTVNMLGVDNTVRIQTLTDEIPRGIVTYGLEDVGVAGLIYDATYYFMYYDYYGTEDNKAKYSGFIIDANLSWKSHINDFCSQLNSIYTRLPGQHISLFSNLIKKHETYSSRVKKGISNPSRTDPSELMPSRLYIARHLLHRRSEV
ncbi:hypothetical protein J6590_004211 [Homalodisca vitripennis]|nr:hypothetical protein J6590_004211 [Homalodisca vitripennis]